MKIKVTVFAALAAVTMAPLALASRSHDDAFARRGQAGDNVMLESAGDSKQERKEPGFFFHHRDKTPSAEQFAAAGEAYTRGDYSGACSLYDTLVRSWPYSAEAAEAQSNLAQLFEMRGKYARAFEEYAYLLEYYPENARVGDILEHMFAIANWNLGKGKRESAIKLFTRLTQIAPGWKGMPETYYCLGLAQLADKNYYEAADAFDTLVSSFPESELAPAAADKHSLALYALSLKYKEDEAIQKRAIALAVAALKDGDKDSADRTVIAANLDDLVTRRDARAFAIARFYDTRRFKNETRIAAYEEFLRKCPQAPQAEEARRRLTVLKGGK